MATRYLYNGNTYTSLYQLRQAIGQAERLTYGNAVTQEDFDKLPLVNKVTVEEYDPLDELPIEALRNTRLSGLEQAFSSYRNSSNLHITTSLGFDINADVIAFSNIEGCIAQLEQGIIQPLAEGQDPVITFMDYNNQPHDLTVDQLKILKAEIAENGSRAYAKKWEYRAQILSADKETLKTMTNFSFQE